MYFLVSNGNLSSGGILLQICSSSTNSKVKLSDINAFDWDIWASSDRQSFRKI